MPIPPQFFNQLPTPHRDKLHATLANPKLPSVDVPRVNAALVKYDSWIKTLRSIVDGNGAPDVVLGGLVDQLNLYKKYIDVDLIFDSPQDFLYREKGQLKLDNSIVEEFVPWLLNPILLPELKADEFKFGPTPCYAAIYFDGSLTNKKPGAGIQVKSKNQDFALSKRLFIRASHKQDFAESSDVDTYIAYVATEIKTNLDKTMFQEACATGRDLRSAVPAARYFLMCEWLDMTPVSTATTDVEEVLILRGKRLNSNVRKEFSDNTKRLALKAGFVKYLDQYPFRKDVFGRWIEHIRGLLSDLVPLEDDVLKKGYF